VPSRLVLLDMELELLAPPLIAERLKVKREVVLVEVDVFEGVEPPAEMSTVHLEVIAAVWRTDKDSVLHGRAGHAGEDVLEGHVLVLVIWGVNQVHVGSGILTHCDE
jgi:hypothetical protein